MLLLFGVFAPVSMTRAATSGLPSEVLLDKGYREMYNLEFIAAHAPDAQRDSFCQALAGLLTSEVIRAR